MKDCPLCRGTKKAGVIKVYDGRTSKPIRKIPKPCPTCAPTTKRGTS